MSAKRSETSRASLTYPSSQYLNGADDLNRDENYDDDMGFDPADRQLSKHVIQQQQQLEPPAALRLGAGAKMDWNDSVDQSGMAEMCQYVQHLETEKRDLQDQVHFLREQDAKQRLQLSAAGSRIEMLQSSLQHSMAASEAHREEKDSALQHQVTERERILSLVALLEEAQKRYEDTERARQHAVYKLSALQASVAEENTQRILAPLGAATTTDAESSSRRGSKTSAFIQQQVSQDDMSLAVGERIEKYKRELELLRQKLELQTEQSNEKQRIAVEMALRSAHLEHTSMLEKVKLECELRLSESRHEETVRSKEIEGAMDEDRYSIRLEMKHALQRAQIEQRVSYLQAQAALSSSSNCSHHHHHHHGESDFSFGTLDEVLVRMQLEQLRTRRFEALKRVLLIRHSKLTQASKDLFCRWRIQTTNSRVLKLNAVLHMHRIVSHLGLRKKRSFFNDWKAQTRLLHVHSYQSQALSCWNRMLAVERISHVIQQRTVRDLWTSDRVLRAATNPQCAVFCCILTS